MTLALCSGTEAADWLVRSPAPPEQLLNFGPQHFEAYARLRFIPDPVHPGQAEDVDLPEDHPSDIAQARRALHALAAFTGTAAECYFCVWEGYSDITLPPAIGPAAWVEVPHRRYALFRGPLTSVDTWEADLGQGHAVAPPAFVWPADRRWCFASDVDPHWAGIGAEQAAVDALLADGALDVVQVRPEERQPYYY